MGTRGTRDSDVPQARMSPTGFIEGGRQMVSTNTLMGGSIRAAGIINIERGVGGDTRGPSGGSDSEWGPLLPQHPKASRGAGRGPELQHGLCPGEGPHTHKIFPPRSAQPPTLGAQSPWDPGHNTSTHLGVGVWGHPCVCVQTHGHTDTRTHVRIDVCTHTLVYTRIYVCVCVFI